MRYVQALGVAVLTALVGYGIMRILPGISESTAAIAGAVAAVAGWMTVVQRRKL
jgi:hypothetical protein